MTTYCSLSITLGFLVGGIGARDGGLAISSVEARWAHRAVRPIRIGGEEAFIGIDGDFDGAGARASTRDLVVTQQPANVRAEGRVQRGERTTRVKGANEARRAEGASRLRGRRSAMTRRGGGGERRTRIEAS